MSKGHFKRPQPTSEQFPQTESFLTIGYDVPWDRKRSPLWALAHYADSARHCRLVMVDADLNWLGVVEETPEALAEVLKHIEPYGVHRNNLDQFCLKKKLDWPAALAMLRTEWKTIRPEERVTIGIEGGDYRHCKWTFSVWQAIDLGVIKANSLTFPSPSDSDLAAFGLSRDSSIAQIMAEVVVQYSSDIDGLEVEHPRLARELKGAITKWMQPALTSLPAFRSGRLYKVDFHKAFLRAFELELIGSSDVDPIKPEFWDVGGQQADLEIYTDKAAFDKACAEADADDSRSVEKGSREP